MYRHIGKRSAFATVCLTVLLSFCMISCGASGFGKKKDSQENLTLVAEGFNAAVRWEDYKTAFSCLSPSLQNGFWELADKLHAKLRIMDFQVRGAMFDSEKRMATLDISFRFYYTHDPRLQSRTIKERWQFNEKDKIWQVIYHELPELLNEKAK